MLVIGYGNPGRGDDGLGPAFASRITARGLPGVTCRVDYQLMVDHALMVADVRKVVFVDALMGVEAPYRFGPVTASGAGNLSSHDLSPSLVMMLAKTLYGAAPEAFVLGISGRSFGEVKEGLSPAARRHLGLAEAFFLDWHHGADAAARGSAHA